MRYGFRLTCVNDSLKKSHFHGLEQEKLLKWKSHVPNIAQTFLPVFDLNLEAQCSTNYPATSYTQQESLLYNKW